MTVRSIRPLFIAVALFALCGTAFGQNFTGPATITQPTTPGDCVKIAASGQNHLADAGVACGGGGGSGTVTSVGLALPSSILTVSGSPVTTSGTLTGTLATQSANTVLAGPGSGTAAAPTFRALTSADLPAGTGTGTVTSVNTGAGLCGGPITTTGTICATDLLGNGGVAITGTTYPIASTDAATELLFTGSSASAWTLAAPSGALGTGFGFSVVNRGTATITITATGNINGASTLTIAAGNAAWVFNDGTTWWAAPIVGAASGTVSSGTSPNVALYTGGTTVGDGSGTTAVSAGGYNLNTLATGTATNGLFLCAANTPGIFASGTCRLNVSSSAITITSPLLSGTSTGVELTTGASSATGATVLPNRGCTTCGLGGAANVPAIVVGGASITNWDANGQNSLKGHTDNIRVVTAAGAVTVTAADYTVEVNKTTGAATAVNLPATPVTGQHFYIKDGKGDAATNNITVTPAAGNIDGSATYVINQAYGAVEIQYDGTKWVVL